MVSAIWARERSYAAARTQGVSASTTWDTHTPFETNSSAASTCAASSRVSRRTRTFVSIARMLCPDVTTDRFLQLGERAWFWLGGEDRAVDVFERVPACAANDDPFPFLFPFEHGTRSDAQFSSNLNRNRDLPLGRDLGLR